MQNSFNIVEGAFSNFFVVDMDGPRTMTYDLPLDEARWYARRGGSRMGAILRAITPNRGELIASLYNLLESPKETTVHDEEDGDIPAHLSLGMLCQRYQLDEHRIPIVNEFVDALIDAVE